MSAQWYDANISLPGCDKNMPGTVMAMARLNRPSLMIYGGEWGETSVWLHVACVCCRVA
jgi:dihydroxyacid dehydratase/phosphogluconate dehydratase